MSATATVPRPKSKASPAQVEANRRNAQKSTGPLSDDGKAISRLNAVKHGLEMIVEK
jgi:hypothetical protein